MKTVGKNTSRVIAISLATLTLSGAVLAASLPRGLPSENTQATNQITDKRPIVTETSNDFGAYDPHGDFGQDKNVKIEHLFLPWEDVDLSSLAIADEYVLQRGRSLLITVEPWSWDVDWRVTSGELLNGILSGRYDANMASVCAAADNLKSQVIIRWAQEMDETDNQFTWAHWKPESYITAYRRMVTVCRQHLKSAKYMWSPKGNPELVSFYPGDEYVDIVGLSLFGLQKHDRDHFGKDLTFAETLEPRYRLVENFGKPIMVAELGYDGDQSYVRNWAENVARKYPEFPRLTGVVYFNDREVYPWPNGYGLPDWRVVSGQATN
ncbi:beta-mannosidase [Mesorhizobium sp. M9A.F.Ca.ET.002.03.1.2]|uniref:glycoside hydrolase family 26 protein n=1 Tax=Mesorhizobium sp. M9A.F.Ca.ET.002.03.1.2 TaxID=2493668 RepID=UPI000F7587BD|nr:glycoside hydrolase family 26 protein [Mesorhizobium sp. M9A.F.Ca.ET.002.03.1.2]AZN98273.1 beta-mannosidase [Mesorhizobium sp. M9A.F.Ca.ET.002.03.1.2]